MSESESEIQLLRGIRKAGKAVREAFPQFVADDECGLSSARVVDDVRARVLLEAQRSKLETNGDISHDDPCPIANAIVVVAFVGEPADVFIALKDACHRQAWRDSQKSGRRRAA